MVALAATIGLFCLVPTAGLAAGSACNEATALIPRLHGVTPLDVGTGTAGDLISTQGLEARGIAYSPDGSRAYIAADDNASVRTFREVNTATGQTLREMALPAAGRAVAITPDGRNAFVALGTASPGVAVVDLATMTMTDGITITDSGHELAPDNIVMAPDGARAYVTAMWGGTLWLVAAIDTATRTVAGLGSGGASQRALAITSDGRYLIVSRYFTFTQSMVRVIDTATLTIERSVNIGYQHVITGAATAADPSLVYVLDETSHDVRVIDVTTGQLVRTISGIGNATQQVAVTWDGSRMIVSGDDGSYSQIAWKVMSPVDGQVFSSGTSSGAGGGFTFRGQMPLCPRNVPDPAPSTAGGSAPGTVAGACDIPIASALDRARVRRRGPLADVTQAVRLDQRGRYTLIYQDATGARVAMARGSTVSTRVLGRVFTAPVRSTAGPAERLVIRARLHHRGTTGLTLRAIYRSADGTLCGTALPVA